MPEWNGSKNPICSKRWRNPSGLLPKRLTVIFDMPMLDDVSMICRGVSCAPPWGSVMGRPSYIHDVPVGMGASMLSTTPSSSATIIEMGFITEPGS